MANTELLKHEPEIQEQIEWLSKEIIDLRDLLENHKQLEGILTPTKKRLRMFKGIYQTCCGAKWMIEACTNELKKEPGNQVVADVHESPGFMDILDKEIETEEMLMDDASGFEYALKESGVRVLNNLKRRYQLEVLKIEEVSNG